MSLRPALGVLAALTMSLIAGSALAQEQAAFGSSGSPLPEQPYTLIYPTVMVPGGEAGGPVVINHPDLPLQCVLAVIPVDDTTWTADGALAALDAATVAEGWNETLPGFVLGASQLTNYQSGVALQYEGASAGTDETAPVTLVHTETVAAGNGYTLDCFYPSDAVAQARPIVDSIIANFSTLQDAQPVVPVP